MRVLLLTAMVVLAVTGGWTAQEPPERRCEVRPLDVTGVVGLLLHEAGLHDSGLFLAHGPDGREFLYQRIGERLLRLAPAVHEGLVRGTVLTVGDGFEAADEHEAFVPPTAWPPSAGPAVPGDSVDGPAPPMQFDVYELGAEPRPPQGTLEPPDRRTAGSMVFAGDGTAEVAALLVQQGLLKGALVATVGEGSIEVHRFSSIGKGFVRLERLVPSLPMDFAGVRQALTAAVFQPVLVRGVLNVDGSSLVVAPAGRD